MTTEEQQQISLGLKKNFNLHDVSLSDFESFREVLKEKIDYLLNNDFDKLLWILYRADVSESKARELLALNPNNPAVVLSDLLIERELQKFESRKNFRDAKTDERDNDLRI